MSRQLASPAQRGPDRSAGLFACPNAGRLAIPLGAELRLFSDGTSTYKVLDLDVPELEELLPHADSLPLEWLFE